MNKKIIGFSGRKRCGKSSLSQFMKEKYHAEIITVAQALKELCCELLDIPTVQELNIQKDANVVIFVDNNNLEQQKEKWVGILQKTLQTNELGHIKIIQDVVNMLLTPNNPPTVRDVLQIVGTNIIREIDINWHTKKLQENILNSKKTLIFVDDIRYPNEKKVIEDLGGETFFIMRPDLSHDISNHSSENSLVWQDFPDDRIIVNYMDLESLFHYFSEYFHNGFHFGINNPILKHGIHDFQNENINNFGYKISDEELEQFRRDIIPNILNHNGCLVLSGIAKTRYERLLIKPERKGMIILSIWNPFIIENIKLYL